MKHVMRLLIIIFNILLMYIYLFSSGTNENFEKQVDNIHDGYFIMADYSENDLENIFEISKQNEMVLVFKNVNYGGTIAYDYEYDVYNFEIISDKIKYYKNGEIISTIPFSKQKINSIDNSYVPSTGLEIFTNDIKLIEDCFNDNNIDYTIMPINEFNSFILNVFVNGKMLLTFIGLFILSMAFCMISRSREIACLYLNGKTDLEIIRFEFIRIFKAHLIIFAVMNIIPAIYLLSLSFSHLLSYLIFIFLSNLIFVLLYFLISYIIIPIIINQSNSLAVLKGQKNLGASFTSLLIICIFFTLVGMIFVNKVVDDFKKPYYYNNILREEKLYEMYTLQGGGSTNFYKNELSNEDNLDIASKALYLEQNLYIVTNEDYIFNDETFEFDEEFINDVVNNKHIVNAKMFNFLEVKDVDGKTIFNNGVPTIYVPQSKYDKVKEMYSDNFEFVKIQDDQTIFTPGGTFAFEFYATDAYYIVEELQVAEENFVYEPGIVGIYFLEDDIKEIKNDYFPQAHIVTYSSDFIVYLEENILFFLSTLCSVIILLVTFIISVIVYYRALFLKNRQHLLINLINGNSVSLIVFKLNSKMNIALLLLAILAYFTHFYIWVLVLSVHLITILIEYKRLQKCNYIQEIKSEV